MPILRFRPLARSDFALLYRWLAEPHVKAWWNQSHDMAGIAAKYEPRIDGREPTHVFIIEYDARSIGFIQWYRWSDYPVHAAQLGAGDASAGLDLAIGDISMIGKEIGPQAIGSFRDRIIMADARVADVMTDIDVRNARSLRAFAKAGFSRTRTIRLEGEQFDRQVVRCERTGEIGP